MATSIVFPLRCAVQKYEWGKVGASSAVADLSRHGDASFTLEESSPYAELWMGTHAKGPCYNALSSQLLSDSIREKPDCVGSRVREYFPSNGQLPYLFKVLSVNKSLSIQAHPNKKHAEQLHATNPDKYPDPNHKPEMAIALTPFEGLCGFRPREEIATYLRDIPEFCDIVGVSNAEFLSSASEADVPSALQKCFTALMTCDLALLKQKVSSLAARIEGASEADHVKFNAELFLRLNSQFPGDGGCFCIYFLNRVVLQPGQAMFLEANLPHAYLSGDCIECMACSDNVVRAGLTPKFKDVPTLCSMLKYDCKPANENLFPSKPHASDPYVTVYNPPIPDFAVMRMEIPSGVNEYTMPFLDSASILLVIEGSASSCEGSLQLCRGSVLFIGANQKVSLKIESGSMLMFRAYCDL